MLIFILSVSVTLELAVIYNKIAKFKFFCVYKFVMSVSKTIDASEN